MAASFPVRVRGPAGVSTVSISQADSIDHVLTLLEGATGISKEQIESERIQNGKKENGSFKKVRIGVPPKPVTIPEYTSKNAVEHFKLQRGDTLVVSASSAVRNPTQSLPTSSPSKIQVQASETSTAPSSTGNTNSSKSKTIEGSFVATDAGNLVIRVVPDDNSCLFRAIGLVLLPQEANAVTILRKRVAQTILEDPETYSDVILGKPREQYMRTIQTSTAWGGYTEISILSRHYQTEIAAIDIQSGRIDRYGEEFSQRVCLLYSGIHYDAATLSPLPPSDFAATDFDTRIFEKTDETILGALYQLAAILRDKHYFTDTGKFTLRCEICKEALVGQQDATKHAMKTGHQSFGEY